MITAALWLMLSMMLEQTDRPFVFLCTNPHLCHWQEVPESMDVRVAEPMDVPAIQVTIPAPYPCNLPTGNKLVCLTGPEAHDTCADKARVLLTDEEGKKHCIKFGETK